MTNLILDLPEPVSTNQLYRNRRARDSGPERCKTQRYLTWIQAAMIDVRRAALPKIEGPCRVEITVDRARRQGVDNNAKCILDLLTSAEVYGDDMQVDELLIIWGRTEKRRCRVAIYPLEDQAVAA